MEPTPEYLSFLERITFALFQLLVVAIVMERGLEFVFRWRYWKKLDGRGLKSIVAVAIGGMICWYYDFDIISRILDPEASSSAGIALTALIAAGGSGGVSRIIGDIWANFRKVQQAQTGQGALGARQSGTGAM